LGLALVAFLVLRPLHAQSIRVVKTAVDSANLLHQTEEAVYFKSLLLIDHVGRDTQNEMHIVYADAPVIEVYLLNRLLHQDTQQINQFIRFYDLEINNFSRYYTGLKMYMSDLDTGAILRLQKLEFRPIDKAKGLKGTAEFKAAILHLWNGIFLDIPDSKAPIYLKALRSFVRYDELRLVRSADEESVETAFNANATFEYCYDSLIRFTELSRQYNFFTRWAPFIDFFELAGADYMVQRNLDAHYQRVLTALPSWEQAASKARIWLIETDVATSEHFPNNYSVAALIGLSNSNLSTKTYTFTEELKGNLDTQITQIPIDFIEGFASRWSTDIWDLSTEEVTESTEGDFSIGALQSPFWHVGFTSNRIAFNAAALNRGLTAKGLLPITGANTIGLDAGYSVPGAMYFTIQWTGQNAWLNWDAEPHFAVTNVNIAALAPIWERVAMQSYIGVDYQYSRHRLSLPIPNQSIANPNTAVQVLQNKGQSFGLTSQSILRLGMVYLKAIVGYRWDLSDARWTYNGTTIESENAFSSSGFHYGLSAGLIFGGN
jgi:hypothetical protein